MRKSIWSMTNDPEQSQLKLQSLKRPPVRLPKSMLKTLAQSTSKGASARSSIRREPMRMENTPHGKRFVPRSIIKDVEANADAGKSNALLMKNAGHISTVNKMHATAIIADLVEPSAAGKQEDVVAVISGVAQAEVAAFPPWVPWKPERTPILLTGKKPSAEVIRAADAFFARTQLSLATDQSHASVDVAVRPAQANAARDSPAVETMRKSLASVIAGKNKLKAKLTYPATTTCQTRASTALGDIASGSGLKQRTLDGTQILPEEDAGASTETTAAANESVSLADLFGVIGEMQELFNQMGRHLVKAKQLGAQLMAQRGPTQPSLTECLFETKQLPVVPPTEETQQLKPAVVETQQLKPAVVETQQLKPAVVPSTEKTQQSKPADLGRHSARLNEKRSRPGATTPLWLIGRAKKQADCLETGVEVSRKSRCSKSPTSSDSHRTRSKSMSSSDCRRRSRSKTPTASKSGRPSRSKTSTAPDSGRRSRSKTPMSSKSGRPSLSKTPTATNSGRPSRHKTPTATDSGRPSQSKTPTATNSGRPSRSKTPTTATDSGRPSWSKTPTATDSGRPSWSKTPTATDSGRPSLSKTPAATDSGRPSRSKTPTATDSGRPSRSKTPTATDSGRPSRSKTPTATDSGRPSRSETPTATGSGRPSRSKTPTATNSGRPSWSKTPTATNSGRHSRGETEPEVVAKNRGSMKRPALQEDLSAAKRIFISSPGKVSTNTQCTSFGDSFSSPRAFKRRNVLQEFLGGESPLATPLDVTTVGESLFCPASPADLIVFDNSLSLENTSDRDQNFPKSPTRVANRTVSVVLQNLPSSVGVPTAVLPEDSNVQRFPNKTCGQRQAAKSSAEPRQRIISLERIIKLSETDHSYCLPGVSVVTESPKKIKTPKKHHLTSPNKSETCTPSPLQPPSKIEIVSSEGMVESSCKTGGAEVTQNPFVTLTRLPDSSPPSPDFARLLREYLKPDPAPSHPGEGEILALMNSPLFKCFSNSDSPLVKADVGQPSASDADKRNPFKRVRITKLNTPIGRLSVEPLDGDTEEAKPAKAAKPAGRKSVVQYERLRKSFPKLMRTPVSTPCARSRLDAAVLDSAAKTSRNVQASLEMLEDC